MSIATRSLIMRIVIDVRSAVFGEVLPVCFPAQHNHNIVYSSTSTQENNTKVSSNGRAQSRLSNGVFFAQFGLLILAQSCIMLQKKTASFGGVCYWTCVRDMEILEKPGEAQKIGPNWELNPGPPASLGIQSRYHATRPLGHDHHC